MNEHACEVCGRQSDGPASLCTECLGKTGLPAPAPVLRPPTPCARCGHHEIVRIRMRDRTSATTGDTNAEVARPFALTWELGDEFKAFFSMQKVRSATPSLERAYGLVEAYVCRACGATELFARQPGHIPIGPEYGTELLVVPGGGYR
ncbi:MAG: hypothetical protein ACRELB_24785 [Polyangiaceae bacterium]